MRLSRFTRLCLCVLAAMIVLAPGATWADEAKPIDLGGSLIWNPPAWTQLGALATDVSAQSTCDSSSTALCLADDRFEVIVTWRKADGDAGSGKALVATSDTGGFWFFKDTNIEMLIKVLNGCTSNDRYWVFAGGLTDVQVNMTITDTLTGDVRTYGNPQGTPFQPIQDTGAFQTCDGEPPPTGGGGDDPPDANILCDREACLHDDSLKQQCVDSFVSCIALVDQRDYDECAAAALLFCNEV